MDEKRALGLNESAWKLIITRWLPNSIESYFADFLGDEPWLDRLGDKEFWISVFLLPFAPVLFPVYFIDGVQFMLSLTHMKEYIEAAVIE